MIKFVCHPSGNDLNGGGYVPLTVGNDYSYAGTWSQWHNNFDALVVGTGLSVVQNGGYIKILGNFTSVPVGIMVYCDFTASYADGRYLVMEADSSHLGLAISYTADTTVNVRVGGAIKSPAAACTLAYGTSGDVLLLPANQSTQTVNEVVDEGNRIVCSDEGATLEMYSVDDSTGIKLTTKDSTKWPVIKASGTWSTANLALFVMESAVGGDLGLDTACKLDKIIFDGDSKTPRIVMLGDNTGDFVNTIWGDIEIRNTATNGYGLYRNCSIMANVGQINSIKFYNCGYGFFNNGNRDMCPIVDFLWFDECEVGIYAYGKSLEYCFRDTRAVIFSNCTIGLYTRRYNASIISSMTFVNNGTDIYYARNSTESANVKLNNCLFYNDAVGGKILDSDDDGTYLSMEFNNCVYGVVGSGGVAFTGITPTLVNCQTISADPFVDKANGDYRLNPASADFDKIWDWNSMTNVIGATTPAQPASGGGVSQLINGGFIR